ncbi:MAG: hypothetical protein ACNS60_07740 [Candidatus Cyclobacteriaceae bacterium M2_1C_046]
MFNENEISSFLEDAEILNEVLTKKKEFIASEAEFLEISEHDFLSLIMMTPATGIALSNGSVSLFEELALNKMARKMSKGGYFLKLDPVAHAMKFFIKSYEKWESPFFDVIKLCMHKSFDIKQLSELQSARNSDKQMLNFTQHLMSVPYGFVRFLTSFFLHDENNLTRERSISKVEYEKITDMGSKLGFDAIPVYQEFLKTFQIK